MFNFDFEEMLRTMGMDPDKKDNLQQLKQNYPGLFPEWKTYDTSNNKKETRDTTQNEGM